VKTILCGLRDLCVRRHVGARPTATRASTRFPRWRSTSISLSAPCADY